METSGSRAIAVNDKERFKVACDEVLNQVDKGRGIGRLGEKALHAILKQYMQEDLEKHEVKLGNYIADIFTDGGVIEIQTRQFAKLRPKLEFFLTEYPVTIVYPIPARKWLVWIDPNTGEATKERLSPKRGNVYDCIRELYAIKPYLDHPGLRIELIYVDLKEYRLLNGWSTDLKRGSERVDRIPIALDRSESLGKDSGYGILIPQTLPSAFTSADYAKHTHIHPRRAQIAMNILKSLMLIRANGKKGRHILYERTDLLTDVKPSQSDITMEVESLE